MKAKRVFPVILFVLICFFSFNAYAGGWTDGWDVVSCGIDSDGMYIVVTDGVKTFELEASSAVAGFTNQALAVCLSANAMPEKVDLTNFSGGKFQGIRYHK